MPNNAFAVTFLLFSTFVLIQTQTERKQTNKQKMKVAPSQDPDVRQIMSSFVRVVSDESLVLLSDSERRV
jgi:hypothetical protein